MAEIRVGNGDFMGKDSFIPDYVAHLTKPINEDLQSHKANKEDPHNVTKAQVGLGNVDNTSDEDKPISKATQEALVELSNHIGNIQELNTDKKENLVGAINELAGTAVKTEIVDDFDDATLNKYTTAGIYKLTVDPDETGVYVWSAYLIVTGNKNSHLSQTFVGENGECKSRHCWMNGGDNEYWSIWWNNYGTQTIGIGLEGVNIQTNDYSGAYYVVLGGAYDTPACRNLTKGHQIIVIPNKTFKPTKPVFGFDRDPDRRYDILVPSLNDTSVGVEHPVPGWFKANVPVRLMFNGECWLAVDYAGVADMGNKDNLITEDKSNLVAAINEVFNKITNNITVKSKSELDKITDAGTYIVSYEDAQLESKEMLIVIPVTEDYTSDAYPPEFIQENQPYADIEQICIGVNGAQKRQRLITWSYNLAASMWSCRSTWSTWQNMTSPVTDGTGKNSVQGPRSISRGDTTTAEGTSQTGIKGYYWYDMDFTSQNDVGITLTKEQNVAPSGTFDIPWEEGDVVSLVNGSKYSDLGSIIHKEKNTIWVYHGGNLPFDQANPVEEWDIDDRTIYVIEKPDAGVVDLGHFASGHGEDTFAIERASDTWGKGTRTPGQYGSARNLFNIAYYACDASGMYTQSGSREGAMGCHTSGRGGKALADYVDVGNVDCIGEAIGSFLRGYLNRSRKGANYSDIGGVGNVATAMAQFIRGVYALIDEEKQYLEIMGNGTSKDNRKNIRTLDWQGNEWLAGTLLLGAERYDVQENLKNALTLLQWEKKTIAEEEYKGCAELTIADFPYTTTIERMAFGQCTALKVAKFKSLTTIGQYGFWLCTAMVSADLPNVNVIDSGAFAEDYNLSDVNIPSAKTIGYQSFYKCNSMLVLDAPKATTVCAQAFYSCSNLKTLILRSDTVCGLENTNAFQFTPVEKGTGFIYVPDALVDSYKSAANWSTFAAQIKGISELEG